MRRFGSCLVLAAALSGALAACAPERSRVVENPSAPLEETQRDYRESLDRVRNRQDPIEAQRALEDAVRRFQSDMARLPTNLLELVQRRYLPEAKQAPDGYAYSYDPVHGNVALVPVTADGLIRLTAEATNETRIGAPPVNLPPPP